MRLFAFGKRVYQVCRSLSYQVLQKLKNTSLLGVFTHAESLFASAGIANAERAFQKHAFQLPHFA